MNLFLLDGHPVAGSLCSHLLDLYVAAMPNDLAVRRIELSQLAFDPVLHDGYRTLQAWEPDLGRVAEAVDWCDHLVLAFPLWWGGMPAQLKGLLDRVLLPHFAFRYHQDDPWWDRLLSGRSADILITMDTPPLFLRFAYGNAVVRQVRQQIFGFCGFKPVRVQTCGPVRQGGADKAMARWQRQISALAQTAPGLRRAPRQSHLAEFLAARR